MSTPFRVQVVSPAGTRHVDGGGFSYAGIDVSPYSYGYTTGDSFDFDEDGKEDIIAMYENVDGALIDAAVKIGAKGLVTAGLGNGNMTDPAVEALAKAAKGGVVCVRSSRVPTGLVGRNIELDDDALGFIASYELSPQKARILLRLALLKTSDLAEIQEYYATY